MWQNQVWFSFLLHYDQSVYLFLSTGMLSSGISLAVYAHYRIFKQGRKYKFTTEHAVDLSVSTSSLVVFLHVNLVRDCLGFFF